MTEPLLASSFLYMLDRLTLVSRRARAGTFKGEQRSAARLSTRHFDGLVPTGTLPASSLLFIAPPYSTELFSETGWTVAPVTRPAARTQPVWPVLLLIAALLFPLDVVARRLRLTRGDAERLLAWARASLQCPIRSSRAAPGGRSDCGQIYHNQVGLARIQVDSILLSRSI